MATAALPVPLFRRGVPQAQLYPCSALGLGRWLKDAWCMIATLSTTSLSRLMAGRRGTRRANSS
eukprot:819272-Alexandrium_andersonii.AAC.1